MTIISRLTTLTAAFILSGPLLAGCGMFSGEDDQPPLEGERISLFAPDSGIGGTAGVRNTTDTQLNLPDVWRNEFWPQTGGYANHAMQHVALNSGELRRAWSSSIGSGSTKSLPLTAQPVMADGRVYALDTSSRVRALDANTGRTLWTAQVNPETKRSPVIGGGVTFGGGRLYVTAGFNEVLALNPADGSVLWRTTLPSATRAAPTFMPGGLFVVTVDNQTIAINPDTGARSWSHQGLTQTTGVLGAAAPAANRDIVLPAYSSGEVYALNATNGAPLWGDSIAPLLRSGHSFTDIQALPVIDRGVVVAMSMANRIAAIDERTGERIWEAPIGGTQTPFVSGNRIYVLSSNAELTALDLATGTPLWSTQLERYRRPDSLQGKIIWYGPLLAGNRLLAVSSHGKAVDIDPRTGAVMREWSTNQDVVAAPIVAGETLYLLSSGGSLTAWK